MDPKNQIEERIIFRLYEDKIFKTQTYSSRDMDFSTLEERKLKDEELRYMESYPSFEKCVYNWYRRLK